MDFFRFQQSGRECVCKWATARNVLKLLYHIVHCAAKYGIHFFVIVHSVLFSKLTSIADNSFCQHSIK